MPHLSHRKSHIYVLPSYASPDALVEESEPNACYQILERDYKFLPDRTKRSFDIVRDLENRELSSIRAWANEFREAYDEGKPLPSRKFGATVNVDTSTMKGWDDLSSLAKALLAVITAKERGVTSIEARRNGEVGGGISGGLTKLHQAGVIVRLRETR